MKTVSHGHPRSRGWRRVLLGIWLAASVPVSIGALSSYDSFAYSPGPLSGNNGGGGWSSAWGSGGGVNPGNAAVGAGTLSYGPLLTGGNHGMVATTAGNTVIFRDFSSLFGGTGTDTWVSYLIDAPESPVDVSLLLGGTPQVFSGSTAGNQYDVLYSGSSVSGGAQRLVLGSFVGTGTRMLVMQFDQTTGGAPVFNAWLDPDFSSLGAGTAPTGGLMTTLSSGTQDFTFDRIRLGEFTTGTLLVDEIRVGATWQDVSPLVPEPGAGVMVVGGICALAARRSRRR